MRLYFKILHKLPSTVHNPIIPYADSYLTLQTFPHTEDEVVDYHSLSYHRSLCVD